MIALTHEAGHAFQVFSSRDIGIPEYLWPTYESCEIHSMSTGVFRMGLDGIILQRRHGEI
ncbi:hypothetical protein LSPH24S_09114 [Lysinibacillus sphaericus]